MSRTALPRLLYLLHSYGVLAGVEVHAQTLAAGLSDRYDVFLAFPRQQQIHLLHRETPLASYDVEPLAWPVTPYQAPLAEQALAKILHVVQPDLVHIQHFLNWPLSVLDQIAAAGIPFVVSFHDYYAITPFFTMQGTDDPEHTFTSVYSQHVFGRDLTPYLHERRRIVAANLRKAAALVSISPYLSRQLATIFPNDYRLIEYGIKPFTPQLKERNWRGLRFGNVGTLIPQKGWHTVYQAFPEVHRRYPNTELHFFGGGQAGIARAPEGITFRGGFQQSDLPRLCAEMDVAIIPSIFAETYCLVLSEMWHGGLPVAVSAIGAMGDRVSDGVNGKKFPPGDVPALTETLLWFLEHDDWRHWTLPRPKLQEAMVEDYDRLYREVLARQAATLPAAPSIAPEAPAEGACFILQICTFGDDGDSYYRLSEPSRQLSRRPGVLVVDCHYDHRLLPSLIERADVVVLPCLHDWDFFPLLERRRAAGQVTVFEANDYFYDVQPWNPISQQWQDRALQDEYRWYMTQADAVQTSTTELARRWQPWARRVAVFPNHLAEIPPLEETPARPLTIGWGGSPGHFADWYHLAPSLERWLRAHPDVHLAVMTNEFARPFFHLPPERYHFTPFGSMENYHRFLQSLDIGLAPLLPTEYNRCRSDVKFLEYAAHGVPGIYADLEPYRETVVAGKTGLFYRDEAELLQSLDRLAADAALRRSIRDQAYAYLVAQRRITERIGERLDFYRSLLPQPPRGVRLAPDVLAAAVCDGNYLQLRPQEAEAAVAHSRAAPPTRASVQPLAQVLERTPDYAAGWQQLGKLHNDLRDYRAALAYLERALRLVPGSARTLGEMGRSYFCLNEMETARQCLEDAMRHNPLYYPGWLYFLRFLALTKAHDAQRWAEQALHQFPHNFVLGLAAARVYPADEALAAIQRLLEAVASTLTEDEKPSAAPQFSQAIQEVRGTSDAIPLLRRCCEVFPNSARLADMLGHALRQSGHLADSRAHHQRALDLRRAALLYRAEFPKEDGTVHYWQFAEHIRKSLG